MKTQTHQTHSLAMDFKTHIQRSIIAGSVAEGKFERVSFLEPSDFDFIHEPIWKVILDAKGDLITVYKNSKTEYFKIYLAADYTYIERYALFLLETRFKTLLIALLMDIAQKSKDATEGLILTNTIKEINEGEKDVFELIDNVPEYLKPFVSSNAYDRVMKMQEYVNKRGEKVKEVLG
jgi:hypothetical protein